MICIHLFGMDPKDQLNIKVRHVYLMDAMDALILSLETEYFDSGRNNLLRYNPLVLEIMKKEDCGLRSHEFIVLQAIIA